MTRLIRVKAGPASIEHARGQVRVAFFERDPAHPGGEVVIVAVLRVGSGEIVYPTFEVAETARVKEAILDGRLVVAD